jgi:flagellar motility protein MotE (MotC chaperone)
MSAEELAAWEERLKLREDELKKKKEDLDLKEQQLADKEKELNVKENNIKIYGQSSPHADEYTQTFQEMLSGLTDEELSYIKRMSVVYAKMEPSSAASIIAQLYDIQKTSAILYYMQPEAAAKIMEQMDQAAAADITEIILS